MRLTSHIGRTVCASLFVLAALHKLSNVDIATGGTQIVWKGTDMGRKMDQCISRMIPVSMRHGSRLIYKLRPWYPVVFVCASVLELVGGIAMILDRPLGAKLLLVFLGVVTLVMHPVSEEEERMACLKNMSLAGGLLMYLSGDQ